VGHLWFQQRGNSRNYQKSENLIGPSEIKMYVYVMSTTI
jgi:hypothetical protein